ncbi:hypothetical protein BHE74_00050665 [Ensete ventricosum]|nr:hypothetical protein BHE74_00050665 [Ensete ventricosum]
MIRHLKGEDLNSLYPKELIPIEEALQIGLASVRDKQHHQQLAMEGNVRELELGYQQRDSEFAPQMTMAFRVQPIQPNLQENK